MPKYVFQSKAFKSIPKLEFCLKIYQLATLPPSGVEMFQFGTVWNCDSKMETKQARLDLNR
jgi:hypothetical protein